MTEIARKTSNGEDAPQPTILLVDDSIAFRLRLRKTLTAAGFDVREAVDGIDALEKLTLAAVDEIQLVVCDVNMPRMNGVELIEELVRLRAEQKTTDHQTQPPLLPLFFLLTSEGRLDLIRRARELGAKGWMFKPYDAADLVRSIRRMVAAASSSSSSGTNEVRAVAS